MPSPATASAGSKIPLPKSRRLNASVSLDEPSVSPAVSTSRIPLPTSPASANAPSSGSSSSRSSPSKPSSQSQLIGRDERASSSSPESVLRRRLGKENVSSGSNGQHSAKPRKQSDPTERKFDSSTFVRRPSPPRQHSRDSSENLSSPSSNNNQRYVQHWEDPGSVQEIDIDSQFQEKVRESRAKSQSSGSGLESKGRKTSLPSPSRIPIASEYVAKSRSSSLSGGINEVNGSTPRGSPTRQPSPPRKLTPPSATGMRPLQNFQNATRSSQEILTVAMHNADSSETPPGTPKPRREADLHLDLNTESPSTPGSRIPLPKMSPARRPSPPKVSGIPTVGFSLSPERMLKHSVSSGDAELAQMISPTSSSSAGNSPSKSTSSAPPSGIPTASSNGNAGRKKKFEAFVMTGDRMINLAKTPANSAFKSKYQKKSNVDVGGGQPVVSDGLAYRGVEASTLEDLPELEADANGGNVEVVRRANPAARRALVRASKSEDQLNVDLNQISPPEDNYGSVNALLDTSGLAVLEPSPEKPQQVPMTTSADLISPDMDTSSMMTSCSEHYNAESVLCEKMSPHSSSSPETPEWSLLDSIHKKNGQITESVMNTSVHSAKSTHSAKISHRRAPLETSESLDEDKSIRSNGGKVIISIGDHAQTTPTNENAPPIVQNQNGHHQLILSPLSVGGSSTGTITPDEENFSATKTTSFSTPNPTTTSTTSPVRATNPALMVASNGSPATSASNHSIVTNSSEEESDIESLHSYHPPQKVIDTQSAARLAKRLYFLDGFKKTDIARHLSKNTDYNHVVAEEYLNFFDFTKCSLDGALRQFLSHFCLTGETQERERVLLYFSKRFLECNPGVLGVQFNSQDSVHTLTCAIMLLNTDLHGENLQRKMTSIEFVENLSELNDGKNFPRDLLKSIYSSIKEKAIPWTDGLGTGPLIPSNKLTEEHGAASPAGGDSRAPGNDPRAGVDSTGVNIGSSAGGYNPFLALPDAENTVDYKNGYVMRKSCYDANGKKTKLGKRSWKMYFLSLRDMVLYCFKDEKTVRVPGAFEDANAAIRVHHGLAVRATDYTKKQFVFRLHTADQAQYLFQTSDEKELLTWIDAINYVVASYSAPALPAPCSSGGRFQRPLLPSSKTRLSAEEQSDAHEKQLNDLRTEIEDHLQNPPIGRSAAKSAVLTAYREKTDFLQFEIMRYETYILTLRTKNGREVVRE